MSRFDSWPLALAYDAGRTARQIAAFLDGSRSVRTTSPAPPVVVAQLVSAPPAPFGGPVHRIVEAVRGAVDRLDAAGEAAVFSFGPPGAPTLQWPDLVALADASGLTDALGDVARRAARHDRDPALLALAAGITRLGPAARDAAARRFLARIRTDPTVEELMRASATRPVPPSPAQLAAVVAVTGASLTALLRELGSTDDQIARVVVIARDCNRPLAALLDSYLAPRTARDRLRRLWRVQRVAWRTAWILHRRRTATGAASHAA